jgi:hypothetical protein
MVDKAAANARQIGNHFYAMSSQLIGRANSGQHEELWGNQGPGCEDYVSARLRSVTPPRSVTVLNANTDPVLDQEALNASPQANSQ